MRWLLVAAAIVLVTSHAHLQSPGAACPRCGWTPPGGRNVQVSSVDELERAIATARAQDVIVVARGTYPLRRTLDITAPRISIRGATGNPKDVVLRGRGMTDDPVGVALSISAVGVTIADLTIRDVKYHAVQVRGELAASRFTLHNAILVDSGQQLLKASTANDGRYADDGLVACSELRYDSHAPSDYTNGIDVLAGKAWVIRDNRIARIRGPERQGWAAGPAILVWAGSEDTIVERNTISDSYRGIALGLAPRQEKTGRNANTGLDHLRGIVRNNVVVNLHPWGDEGIEANAAAGARIDHNTVIAEGRVPWSISIRFPAGPSLVRNNLTTRRVALRNGAQAQLEGNVDGARRDWFANLPGGDLHLTLLARPAIDAGVALAEIRDDFDRRSRPAGARPDAGAFEFQSTQRGARR